MTKTELNAFRRALESRLTELGNGTRNREALAIETSVRTGAPRPHGAYSGSYSVIVNY